MGFACAIDQTGKDGQAANSIGEDMVEDDDQRRPALTRIRHQRGCPQGTIARQPGEEHLGRNLQDCALAAGRRTPDHGDVVGDGEITIIDPNRPSAP